MDLVTIEQIQQGNANLKREEDDEDIIPDVR